MVDLVVAASAELLAPLVAGWLEEETARAIRERGACSLCLAGGRTPATAYRQFAAAPLDWTRVSIYFGDERGVPPDHPDSNFRMLGETLLSLVPIPPAQVHRMEAERSDRDRAAAEYARLLPTRLDILLLGMGGDGHTASLFPGSPALRESQLVVPVVGTKPPAERMSITPGVIEASRQVAVLATGSDKADMVARALEGPYTPELVPVQLARHGRWFLDQAAASRLTDRRNPG